MRARILICLLVSALAAGPGNAAILGAQELTIRFTDPQDAQAKATWSDPKQITVTEEGLGWDGPEVSTRTVRVQTTSLAVGLYWRPANAVDVTASLVPRYRPDQTRRARNRLLRAGTMSVRYSADAKHWSPWQAMRDETPEGEGRWQRDYRAAVAVPQREWQEYMLLTLQYRKLDVPWKSDEEAAVKWILQNDPKFFEKHIPFVGYLQFRYEGPLYGDQRISGLHIRAGFGVSGLHIQGEPRDKSDRKHMYTAPWRFRARP